MDRYGYSRLPGRIVLVAIIALSLVQLATIGESYADIPKPGAVSSPNNGEVNRLLQAAMKAYREGQPDLAVIQLKNAVQVAPKNGMVRFQLGVALLAVGDSASAELELRQARSLGAPQQLVVPPLLQVMLLRNEAKAILDEFADPGAASKDPIAPDILRGRAMALASYRQLGDANSAMDRALALRRDAPLLLARARLAQMENDFPLATKLLDEALKKSPNNLSALLFKVELLRHRDNNQALATVNQALVQYPGNLSAKMVLVEVYEDLGRDQDAMNVVSGILAKSPGLSIAVYYKAAILAHKKDFRGAWLIAQSLPSAFVQSDPNVALTLAQIAGAAGSKESAGAILAMLVNNHPENATARLRLAVLRMEQNNNDEALSVLSPLAEAKDPRALVLMAQAYQKEGRTSDAMQALQKANLPGSGNSLAQERLGLSELSAGKTDQGLQDLEAVAAADPGRADLSGPLIAGLIHANRLPDALSAIARMEKAAPKSAYPSFYRGQVFFAQRNATGAIAAFSTAIQMDPKFVPAFFYRAMAEQAAGNIDAASQDLDRIIALDPKNALALVQKAALLSSRHQDSQAVGLLNRAIATVPNNNMPRLALTNFLLLRQRYPEAEAALNAWLKAFPDDPEALARLGQVQFLLGKKPDAVATYRRLVAKSPQSASAQMLLAAALAATGDAPGAKAAGTRAVEISPDSVQLRAAFIAIEANLGDATSALAIAKAFQVAHPDLEGDILVAETLLRIKRTDEAIAILKARLQSKPDNRVVLLLGQAELSSGDSKSALAYATDWLKKNPDDAAVLRFRANTLLAAGQGGDARPDYEAELRKVPNDPVALNDLAWVIQDKDPKRALDLATKASQLAPDSPEIMDTLGWLQFRQGQTKAALDSLQRAHEKRAANPEIGYHLALVMDAAGQRQQAKALLQAVVSSGSGFADGPAAKATLAKW